MHAHRQGFLVFLTQVDALPTVSGIDATTTHVALEMLRLLVPDENVRVVEIGLAVTAMEILSRRRRRFVLFLSSAILKSSSH